MRKLICLLVLLAIPAVVFAEEVVKKTKFYFGSMEIIYYVGDKEVAREKLDLDGNIIEKTGKVPDGIVKEYYSNGRLASEQRFKNGKPEGISKQYYQNGRLKAVITFKDGKLIRSKYYDEWGRSKGAIQIK